MPNGTINKETAHIAGIASDLAGCLKGLFWLLIVLGLFAAMLIALGGCVPEQVTLPRPDGPTRQVDYRSYEVSAYLTFERIETDEAICYMAYKRGMDCAWKLVPEAKD